MGRAGPEGDPGALEPQAAELRRVPPGRERGRRPDKGGAPRRRGDRTERDLVERLGRRGQGDRVGWAPDSGGWPGAVQRRLAGPGSRRRSWRRTMWKPITPLRVRPRPPPMLPAPVDRSRPAGRPSLAQPPVPDHRDLPWPHRGRCTTTRCTPSSPNSPGCGPARPYQQPAPGAETGPRRQAGKRDIVDRSRDTLGSAVAAASKCRLRTDPPEESVADPADLPALGCRRTPAVAPVTAVAMALCP